MRPPEDGRGLGQLVNKKRGTPHRTATRKPDRVVTSRSGPGYRPQPLRSTKAAVATLLEGGEADRLLAQMPALLWVDTMAYQQLPSNLCLAASHSLRQAYRWLGLQADVVPVTLAIEDVSGRVGGMLYGNARLQFTSDAVGDGFAGHCILRLPELGRFVDATAGQFPQIAVGAGAPVVGRDVTGTHDLLDPHAARPGGIALQREDWILTYRPVERGYAAVVYDQGPYATAEGRDGWHENGMRLVAQTLALRCAPGASAQSSPRILIMGGGQERGWTGVSVALHTRPALAAKGRRSTVSRARPQMRPHGALVDCRLIAAVQVSGRCSADRLRARFGSACQVQCRVPTSWIRI